jgi:predicted DNA-binding transcriptional regulator AlpA
VTTLRRNMTELPTLEGWITLPEAADQLGMTRARTYQLVQEWKITTAHKLGGRPVYIVRQAEIDQLKAGRAEERAIPAMAAPTGMLAAGGVAITTAQAQEAIVVLKATQSTHGSFKQAMLKAGNPLAASDYMETARNWRAAHPAQARGLNTKQVLSCAYEELLNAPDPTPSGDQPPLEEVAV